MIRSRVRSIPSIIALVVIVAFGIYAVAVNVQFGWRVYVPVGVFFAFGTIMLVREPAVRR